MPLASRITDACTEPGFSAHNISSGAGKVNIQGKKAARVGDTVTTHTASPPTHSSPTIASGSGKVRIQGKFAARINDPITCGSKITGSCSKVNIN